MCWSLSLRRLTPFPRNALSSFQGPQELGRGNKSTTLSSTTLWLTFSESYYAHEQTTEGSVVAVTAAVEETMYLRAVFTAGDP